jgi:membrane protease subunit HflC
MSRFIAIPLAVVAVIALFGAYGAMFTVHQSQQALVLRFGDPRTSHKEPGLKFKWPIVDNVLYVEKRILDLDATESEVITADQKRVVMDAYARFRIDDPLLFYRRLTNLSRARDQLGNQLNSTLRNVIGAEDFTAVISTKRSDMMEQIRDSLNTQTRSLGIEIVDVRIRRMDLPEANSQAIYSRMETERKREAIEFRAQGREEAARIRAEADRESVVIRAEARRESDITRGQGEAERNRIFAEAYGQDPDFFGFYRSMKAYETALRSGETTMILSPDSEFFRYFGDLRGRK